MGAALKVEASTGSVNYLWLPLPHLDFIRQILICSNLQCNPVISKLHSARILETAAALDVPVLRQNDASVISSSLEKISCFQFCNLLQQLLQWQNWPNMLLKGHVCLGAVISRLVS